MKLTLSLLSTTTSLFYSAVSAAPWLRDRIPNGYNVPNPYIPGTVWPGVGHLAVGGGGPRNPFGLDFKDAGFEWNVALCQKDSDGDGRSNGEELGDPDCIWTPGEEPTSEAVSHPGIVDEPREEGPIGETCEDYEAPDDLVTMDIVFTAPNTLAGQDRTEYICEQKTYTSPSLDDTAFHSIRTEVINDNPDVLHHIWIYVCDGVESSDGNMVNQGAYSCNGIEGNCQIVAGWAVGAKDFCEPKNVGAYIDFGTGNKVFKIEAHYDNVRMETVTDQSGMRLHFTPTLRPLDNNFVILGMDYWDRQFVIPPKEESFSLTNICPTEATQRLQQPIYAYSWNPHMHYYGVSMVTEQYRCGKKIGELGRIDAYDFNNQQSYVFENPIKILPGDAIVTTCTYNTTSAEGPVLGGEETTDEMCDNYLMYYPYIGTNTRPNVFTACSSFLEGMNPLYSGSDDTTPFVTLDLSGSDYVLDFSEDPTENLPACCSANDDGATCAENLLADDGEPCGVDEDCLGDGICNGGLCEIDDGCTECRAGRVSMYNPNVWWCWEVCVAETAAVYWEGFGFECGTCSQ